MARLSLSFLDTFEVALAGEPVAAFEYDKVRALLAYLAVEADRPHRRDRLAGLLWPERPEPSARQNLSQALFVLRRAIRDGAATPPFLIATPQTLQFNPLSDYELDVTVFTHLLAACQAHDYGQLAACDACQASLVQAAALYRGDFLAGFSLADSPTFEEWALLHRERLHRLAMEALGRLVAAYEGRGRYAEALPHAWRQVELDPWREDAQRGLMRLLALSGQRELALAQYHACRRLLAVEFGVVPAEETTRLYEQIRAGGQELGIRNRVSGIMVLGAGSGGSASLVTDSPIPVTSTPFVARERELGRLNAFLQTALAGRGRVVFVTGGAGRGKTALIHEFARRAQVTLPDLVVGGSGNAHTGLGDPYLPFREVLGLLTGNVEARCASGAISQDQASRLWGLLPLATQALPDAGPEQYIQVLAALARQKPLLLWLDDLQWADPASINLLFHLGRRLAGYRILVVGAYRPVEVALGQAGERHPLGLVVNELKRLYGDIEVDLSQAEERQFIDAFLDTEPNCLDDVFRQALYAQTRGHPLFTLELLRAMQARRDLVQDAQGCWVAGPTLDWETLPACVEGVIAERIGRLPEHLRQALTVASVEGETFTAEVVARVRAVGAEEMVRWLGDQLARVHRLVEAVRVQTIAGQRLSLYRFRHIMFQKYLYAKLDPAERAYLYQAVGAALDVLYGERAGQTAVHGSTVPLRLARHFQGGGMVDKVVD